MSSILKCCSRQARIAAEILPLYRRGAEAAQIEYMISRNDRERRLGIRDIAEQLRIPLDTAEGIYDQMRRREFGIPE